MTDWAIAGAGWIAAVHGLAVRALDDRVVAVASRRDATAVDLASEVGGRAATYDELPAGGGVVIVATPPGRHAADALRAVAGGAAVVVETPLTTTLADADRLVRVADAGASVTYAENLLFSDIVSAFRTELAALGPLQHLTARALVPRPSRRHPQAEEDGREWADRWGGGVVCDVGVHSIAVVLRAVEPARPIWVRASFEADGTGLVEDRAELQVGFDTGLVARIETSWRVTSPVWDVQAASADGVAVMSLLPDLTLERNGELLTLPPPPEGEHPPQLDLFGYVDQLRDARDHATSSSAPAVSDAAFGRDVLVVVCAAATAARIGEVVPLPFTGPRDATPARLWRGE